MTIVDLGAIHRQRSERERLACLVDFARRAPSSHNTQPWRFHIRERRIEVWGDEGRTLPASDTNQRQFFISLGCALENLLVAADYYRLPVTVTLFPDRHSPFFAARLAFKHVDPAPRANVRHLAHAVASRHANRHPYHDQAVPASFFAALRALETPTLKLHIVQDAAGREALTTVVGDATEAAFRDRGFTRELSHWIKPSLRKYRDGMPGYNIGIPWPVSFIAPLAIRYLNVAKQQRKMIEEPLRATPAFIVISTKDDNPAAWVMAGRVLERAWLMATDQGLKMAPFAAGIQIGDFYRDMQRVLNTTFRPQAFSRLGYADAIPPAAPRRRLEEIISV